MQNSTRILINTGAQYVRAIINIVLSFIATRVVLKVLGVEDYGIYVLIAGVVSILSFLTSSLVITTQRFLSVAQGENDITKSQKIFSTSLTLHIVIGFVVIAILEILYPIFFNGILNIPETRITAAKILYHIVILILFLTLVTSPFRAILVSHENIVYISIIEILDSIFKVLIAISLYYFTHDKLIVYGMLLLGIQVFNLITLSVYSYWKYEECILPNTKLFEKKHLKELSSFTGWTMYNLICNLGRTQGLSILLNRYYGPAINASYGLGFQVSGGLSNISSSLLNAMNPQLMKAKGNGNHARMLRLAEIESKFAFFLLSAFAIPCMFEMPRLLELWLGKVPEYAVLFCNMVILAALSDVSTVGLGSANQAIGNIKQYTLVICTIKLSTLIVAIILLHIGLDIFYIAIAYVAIEFISAMYRLPFLKKTAGMSIRLFAKKVFVKELIPVATLVSTCLFITNFFNGQYRLIFTLVLSIVVYVTAIYYTGLCNDEKNLIDKYINKIYKKRIYEYKNNS